MFAFYKDRMGSTTSARRTNCWFWNVKHASGRPEGEKQPFLQPSDRSLWGIPTTRLALIPGTGFAQKLLVLKTRRWTRLLLWRWSYKRGRERMCTSWRADSCGSPKSLWAKGLCHILYIQDNFRYSSQCFEDLTLCPCISHLLLHNKAALNIVA